MPSGECISTRDRPAGGNTGRLFLTFGGPVFADRNSICPLDRVLTYKNLIYLLNLQFTASTLYTSISVLSNERKHNLTTDSNKTQWGMTGRVMGRGMN